MRNTIGRVSADDKLLSLEAVKLPKTAAAEKLAGLVSEYPWEDIKAELHNLATKTSSKHSVLKFIAAPARLEFLTALAIKSQLPDAEVVPNYPCDDEGLPTSTAGGNAGDIECREHPNGVLVEVTMAEGRQQTMMEIWPIGRHLSDFKKKFGSSDAQCMFIAPSIFSDSIKQIKYVKQEDHLTIRPYEIAAFIEYMSTAKALYS